MVKYNVHKEVYEFQTKNKEGFTDPEIEQFLKNYPELDRQKFENALTGITCMMIDGEFVIYHCDIELAVICGLEKRELTDGEWD